MKAPLGWLREYVDILETPEQLAGRLTAAGLEVEGIEIFGAARCEGVKVCEVLRIERPAQLGGMLLCEINDGEAERRVVCGARNVEPGDKVPYAPPGAALPGGRRIERAEIHGVDSEGMLCAEDELGLSDDHSGVMRLARETPAGADFAGLLGGPEAVLSLEITPNRPDCLSIVGIAREIAALYGRELRLPELKPGAGASAGGRVEFDAVVADAEDCPRYTLRVIRDVSPGPSSVAVQRRLLMCGCRPINNIVDITNYVMFECGQPLHAFDFDLIRGNTILVRRAEPGEEIVTLDGARRILGREHLVIADGKGPVAVAGIMGGEASGITGGTRVVLLESACFNPALVRRGVKSLGFSSESSYRFERGVDAAMCDWAGQRAAELMADCAGGVIEPEVVDIKGEIFAGCEIACRFGRVRALLGYDVSGEAICGAFAALGLKVLESSEEGCRVATPSFRPDLANEADLAEEVARMQGLDNIPTVAPARAPGPAPDDFAVRATMKVRSALAGMGLFEIVNYSFVSGQLLDLFSLPAEERLALPNPLSAEHAFLRLALIPQMVETLGRNRARQREEAAFFEIGRVFSQAGAQFKESEHVAVGLMGPVGFGSLEKRRKFSAEQSFLWAKGILEQLCRAMRSPLELRELGAAQKFRALAGCLRPAHGAAVYIGGAECGILGIVAPAAAAEWRIAEPVAVWEMALEALTRRAPEPAAEPLPAFPSTSRDVALIVPEELEHGRIVEAVRRHATKELTRIELFDIYKSKEIGVNRKSMAYSLTYQSAERTLTDEEVNAMHKAVVDALRKELKAEIREQ